MKKCMNQPEDFVNESLAGILSAYPDAYRSSRGNLRAFCRAQTVPGKVAIVTGGGYGHLPVFLGYVGEGLCDGAAVGNVFTSPSCETILDVSRSVEAGAGILYLFGNYFGDGMNFEMAAEFMRSEGIETAMVRFSDDLASAPRDEWSERRGIAGIFFGYRLAGACAARMAPLKEVARVAHKTAENTSSFGVAFSSCMLPSVGKPIFTIGDNEIEIGMGIHGEPGVRREKLRTSRELAGELGEALLQDQGAGKGTRVAILVNGLGATSREELFILYRDLKELLAERGITVVRPFIGEYGTSLEMAGVSVSLLRLDKELEDLLAMPASTPFAIV